MFGEMFGLMFSIRYQDDGMWATATEVAYFPTPWARAAFAAHPFIGASRILDEEETTRHIVAAKSGD